MPILLKASEVLPKDLLKGTNYTVKESVKNDGWFNVYELTTDYGPVTAQTTAELMNRISELRALAAMEEMNQAEEFGEGLVEGVKAPVRVIAKLATSPIKTTARRLGPCLPGDLEMVRGQTNSYRRCFVSLRILSVGLAGLNNRCRKLR